MFFFMALLSNFGKSKMAQMAQRCNVSLEKTCLRVSFCNCASRDRILKHLVEAEKSTFQGELSFQRSVYSRAHSGFIFCVGFEDYFE
jgi:hypothetical protein